jgi:hypothetical protein
MQRHRVGIDFFIGLTVALPLALMLWAVVAWLIWHLAR